MNEGPTKIDLALMMAVAILFDGSQIFLEWTLGWIGVGFMASPFVSIFAIPSYFIWFSIKGMMNINMGMKLFAVSVGEVVPLVNELPGFSGLIGSEMINRAKEQLGPLGAAIPTGGKAPGAAANTAPPTPKAPAETHTRRGKGTTTITDASGKVIFDEERF
jgi:hypothetical protein